MIVQGPVAGCGKRRRSLEAMPEFAEEFVSPVPCIFSESVGPLLSGAQNETRVTGLQGMADVRSLEVPPARRPTPLRMAGLAVSPAQKPEVRLRFGRRIPRDDVDDAAERAGTVKGGPGAFNDFHARDLVDGNGVPLDVGVVGG